MRVAIGLQHLLDQRKGGNLGCDLRHSGKRVRMQPKPGMNGMGIDFIIVLGIECDRLPDLAEVGQADCFPCVSACSAKNRKQQRRQDGDDRYDNEKFDQCKCPSHRYLLYLPPDCVWLARWVVCGRAGMFFRTTLANVLASGSGSCTISSTAGRPSPRA